MPALGLAVVDNGTMVTWDQLIRRYSTLAIVMGILIAVLVEPVTWTVERLLLGLSYAIAGVIVAVVFVVVFVGTLIMAGYRRIAH